MAVEAEVATPAGAETEALATETVVEGAAEEAERVKKQ